MNNPIQNLSRRGFLQGAAGLTLGHIARGFGGAPFVRLRDHGG